MGLSYPLLSETLATGVYTKTGDVIRRNIEESGLPGSCTTAETVIKIVRYYDTCLNSVHPNSGICHL